MSFKKKRISLIVNSLSKGGAERSNAMISRIIQELGHEITIVSVNSGVDFGYAGRYYCMEEKFIKNPFIRKFSKLLYSLNFFYSNKFDVIIDARSRPTFYKTFFYKKVLYKKTPVISLVHNSNLNKSFPRKKWQARCLYKDDYIVTVSKAITEIIKKQYALKKVRTIYNAIQNKELEENALLKKELPSNNYILYYGRLSNKSKNLFFLINAYAESVLPEKNIKLILLGQGPDKLKLLNRVKELGLEKFISFEDYTTNPMPYVKNALFTVMTSNYEGFPMTIVESLSLGTPLVTLDFVSGPSEIIETGNNGILVKEKTIESYSKALNKMVTDEVFYANCKSNCNSSIAEFRQEKIAKSWNELLNDI